MVDIHLKALNGTEEPEFMSLLGFIELGFGMLEFGCVEHHKIIQTSGSGRAEYLERTVLVLKHLIFCTMICMIVLYNMWFEIKIND